LGCKDIVLIIVFDILSASLVALLIKFLAHAANLQTSFSGPSLAILGLLKPIPETLVNV
jgi:hypothetical protein